MSRSPLAIYFLNSEATSSCVALYEKYASKKTLRQSADSIRFDDIRFSAILNRSNRTIKKQCKVTDIV